MIANDKFLGGIITVSSQILCMEDGVIDTVLGHINHQKKTSPTALWLFKIHSDTFRHLREIIDNVSDVHSRNRFVTLGYLNFHLPDYRHLRAISCDTP